MGEYGAGGALSAGSRQYIWLPTSAGPMPVATVQNNSAVQSVMADHLNTPCRVMHADGTLLWQWPLSAFGETPPTIAQRRFATVAPVEGEFEFNLRYPGQYFDKESELHYNGFRTYDPKTGQYTQPDPIGLAGGWNRFNYVGSNALAFSDPNGLAAQAVAPVAMALPAVMVGYAISPGFRSLVNNTARQCFGAIERMFSESANSTVNPSDDDSASGTNRPEGVPENWVEVPSRDGKGTKWIDPNNPKGGDYVRERGDGTLTQVKNGRALDSTGVPASNLSSTEAHFPRDHGNLDHDSNF